MFYHGYPQHPQPTYIDLAALAEVRAAEAAAKAAEAEYLAQNARALQQRHLEAEWFYPPRYAPQLRGLGFQRLRALGGEPALYASPFEPSISERQLLEAKIQEERLARLLAEHQLKIKEQELRQREQRLAQSAYLYPWVAPLTCPARSRSTASAEACPSIFAARNGARCTAAPAPKPRRQATIPQGQVLPAEELVFNSFFAVPTPSNVQATQTASSESTIESQNHKQPTRSERDNQPAEASPKGTPVPNSDSLIDQLKARYEKEGESDIRDTIQTIVNTLSNSNNYVTAAAIRALSSNPSRPSASAPKENDHQDVWNHLWATIDALSRSAAPAESTKKPTNAAVPSTTNAEAPLKTSSESQVAPESAPTDPKGKAKAANPEPDTTASTSRDVLSALERVERITTTFKHLSTEFSIPSTLDFTSTSITVSSTPSNNPLHSHPSSPQTSDINPQLAFTARNHPVHYYEQALLSLLSQLDLIDSYGDQNLRQKRKGAVQAIEEALQELEGEISGRWKANLAKMATQEEPKDKAQEQELEGQAVKESEDIMEAREETVLCSEPEFVGEAKIDGEAALVVAVEHAQDEEDKGIVGEEAALKPTSSLTHEAPVIDSLADLQPEARASSPIAETAEHSATATAIPIIEEQEVVVASASSQVSLIEEDASPTTTEGDAFLLARAESPALQSNVTNRKGRHSVEVEDLGSDWEDVDA